MFLTLLVRAYNAQDIQLYVSSKTNTNLKGFYYCVINFSVIHVVARKSLDTFLSTFLIVTLKYKYEGLDFSILSTVIFFSDFSEHQICEINMFSY